MCLQIITPEAAQSLQQSVTALIRLPFLTSCFDIVYLGSSARDTTGGDDLTSQLGLQLRTAHTFTTTSIDTICSNISNMATQLQASTPPTLTDNRPGFFKTFPRELRDAVYDFLYQEVTANVEGLHFHMRTVLVELRLMSRQFRLEYDERSAADEHNNHLTITDNPEFALTDWSDDKPQGAALHCPALTTRATSLTLCLIACMATHESYAKCNAEGNVGWHMIWITSLLQSLPHLRDIHARLHLLSTGCISTVLVWAELLAALPNLAELQIVGVESVDKVGSVDDSVLLATWSKQHGLQEDHGAIELYRKLAKPSQL